MTIWINRERKRERYVLLDIKESIERERIYLNIRYEDSRGRYREIVREMRVTENYENVD